MDRLLETENQIILNRRTVFFQKQKIRQDFAEIRSTKGGGGVHRDTSNSQSKLIVATTTTPGAVTVEDVSMVDSENNRVSGHFGSGAPVLSNGGSSNRNSKNLNTG